MFPKRLKELRIKGGLLQSELAEKLNISNRTISMYEQGKSEPNVETLINIANYFHVTTDFLVGLSNIEHTNVRNLQMSKCLGLTEKSIERLRILNKIACDDKNERSEIAKRELNTANLILGDPGCELLDHISYYLHFSATHFKNFFDNSSNALVPISKLELWDEFLNIGYSDDWDLWSNALLVLINNELGNYRRLFHSKRYQDNKD